jgi:hypothetical protein
VSALKEVTAALLASSVFVTFAARSFTSCKPQRTQFTSVPGTADAWTPFTCFTGTQVHILTLRRSFTSCKPQRTQFTSVTGTADASVYLLGLRLLALLVYKYTY